MQVIQDGFELTERKIGKSPLGDDRFKNIIKTKRNKNYIEDLEIINIYQLRSVSGFLSLFNFDYYLLINNDGYCILRTSTKHKNINHFYEEYTLTELNYFEEISTNAKIIIYENMILSCDYQNDESYFRFCYMRFTFDFNKRDYLENCYPDTLCNNLSYLTEYFTYKQNKVHNLSIDKIISKNSNDDILIKITFINENGNLSPVFNLTFEHNNSYAPKLNLTNNLNEIVIKKRTTKLEICIAF